MTSYSIGQTVTVEVTTARGPEFVTGTVANTLPREHFEHCVLVVIRGRSEGLDGQVIWQPEAQYVGWYAPEQLDAWQAQAA